MTEERARWTNKEEILSIMDVSTGACTGCKRPARVPEDVIAVHEVNGVLSAIICCEECLPEFTRMMDEAMRRRFSTEGGTNGSE